MLRAILALPLLLIGLVMGASAQAASAPAQYRELIEGKTTAKVMVVEYASLTCPHCAHFYVENFPELKKNYIDTGKIKFVFRDLPTPPQNLAMAAAALARCVPNNKGLTFIGALYKNQQEWMKNPEEELRKYAGLSGLDKDGFDACLTNQDVIGELNRVAQTGLSLYKVQRTPSFVVNDELVEFENYQALATAIDKALAKAK